MSALENTFRKESCIMAYYNLSTDFRLRSLDKTHHVVPNKTGISQYKTYGLIFVVQFFTAVQIKKKCSFQV